MSFSRRGFLAGAGTAAAVTAVGTAGAAPAGAQMALAHASPIPLPIPGTVPGPPDPIHWSLPGGTDEQTQIIGLQGMGEDIEGSTITNFQGKTALAVVAGRAYDDQGAEHTVEFDVRVMQGDYVGEDGDAAYGTFVFL